MIMVRVIINADDLGKDHAINMAINEALLSGAISSATIMANSVFWDEIHNIVNNNPHSSFGVHLNLTEGLAMTNSPVLLKYGIVDSNFHFTKQIQEMADIPEELNKALYEELDAQIKKVVIDENIRISHVDSHHHIHTKETLLPVILKLIKEWNIPAVRCRYKEPLLFTIFKPFYKKKSGNAPTPEINIQKKDNSNCDSHKGKKTPLHAVNTIISGIINNQKWREKVKGQVRLTDYFSTYESAYRNLSQGMKYPRNSVVELMCHPGHSSFGMEMQLVNSCVIKNYLDCKVINYWNI